MIRHADTQSPKTAEEPAGHGAEGVADGAGHDGLPWLSRDFHEVVASDGVRKLTAPE